MVTMYTDLLARAKNALRVKKESFQTPFSKMDFEVAKVLAKAGYLKEAEKRNTGKRSVIEVKLRYGKSKEPALSDFKLISKPSRRVYVGYRELRPVKQGHGLGVLSTPQGVLTHKDARKKKVGGEYLFEVW